MFRANFVGYGAFALFCQCSALPFLQQQKATVQQKPLWLAGGGHPAAGLAQPSIHRTACPRRLLGHNALITRVYCC